MKQKKVFDSENEIIVRHETIYDDNIKYKTEIIPVDYLMVALK